MSCGSHDHPTLDLTLSCQVVEWRTKVVAESSQRLTRTIIAILGLGVDTTSSIYVLQQ